MSPKSNDRFFLIRTADEWTHKGYVVVGYGSEGCTGGGQGRPRIAQSLQKLRKVGSDFSLEPSGRANHADSLISDFSLPNGGKNRCLVF